ncbi:MAG TPA: hypothetical protein VFM37_16265 [Pseudonocardiaceae bacterium]|nr:hypothetical protein [Pseudonocardiaceae bacterium]
MGRRRHPRQGKGQLVNEGKTDVSRRDLPLPAWLVDMLRHRRALLAQRFGVTPEELAGPVFPNSLGRLRDKHNTLARWREFRERAGYPWVTFRAFHRSVATILDAAGTIGTGDRRSARELEGLDHAGRLPGPADNQPQGGGRARSDQAGRRLNGDSSGMRSLG